MARGLRCAAAPQRPCRRPLCSRWVRRSVAASGASALFPGPTPPPQQPSPAMPPSGSAQAAAPTGVPRGRGGGGGVPRGITTAKSDPQPHPRGHCRGRCCGGTRLQSACIVHAAFVAAHLQTPMCPPPSPGMHQEGRDQRWPQRQLGRRLEEVAKAVGGGYCRLQMPLRLALGVRGTVAGHRLGALKGGGGASNAPLPIPALHRAARLQGDGLGHEWTVC